MIVALLICSAVCFCAGFYYENISGLWWMAGSVFSLFAYSKSLKLEDEIKELESRLYRIEKEMGCGE